MRLPRYSRLLTVPADFQLLHWLIGTLVVTGSALITKSVFEPSLSPVQDSLTIVLAILFAGCATSIRTGRAGVGRATSYRSVLAPAGGWVLCESVAVWIVHKLDDAYAPCLARISAWGALTFAAVIAGRLLVSSLESRRDRTRAVAVVGRADLCARFARDIAGMRTSAYRIDAQFDTRADAGTDSRAHFGDVPVFRNLDAFASYVRERRIDELWLALPLTDEATLLRFLDMFRHDLVNIRFIPDVSRLARFQSNASPLDDAMAINLVGVPLNEKALVEKTLFDRVFAACVIVAITPALLAIACGIKLTSPGPVLFTQRRHGANGRPFHIYKFRTMHVHAPKEGVVVQATKDDPRITRFGAFLRRTSLDELPQFFNVLRGDMSVVGPRPHAIEHDEHYQNIVDGYIHRYRIKPGITGWAQINGLRGETDSIDKMQRRVEHDLHYLSNWSFALDMRIVLATIARGFVHRNAY
jgi:Undecaprenyl-phosphate glucose phosphotransferase